MRKRAPDPVVAEFAAVDAASASAARDMAHLVAPGVLGNRWAVRAQVFGRLVAQGLLDLEEAEAAMLARASAAEVDMPGRVRLGWALRDSVAAWTAGRDRTRFGIRRAVGPLLAERRPAAALLAAARGVNEAAGAPLRDAEVVAEVRREVFWAARRAAKEVRRLA